MNLAHLWLVLSGVQSLLNEIKLRLDDSILINLNNKVWVIVKSMYILRMSKKNAKAEVREFWIKKRVTFLCLRRQLSYKHCRCRLSSVTYLPTFRGGLCGIQFVSSPRPYKNCRSIMKIRENRDGQLSCLKVSNPALILGPSHSGGRISNPAWPAEVCVLLA